MRHRCGQCAVSRCPQIGFPLQKPLTAPKCRPGKIGSPGEMSSGSSAHSRSNLFVVPLASLRRSQHFRRKAKRCLKRGTGHQFSWQLKQITSRVDWPNKVRMSHSTGLPKKSRISGRCGNHTFLRCQNIPLKPFSP